MKDLKGLKIHCDTQEEKKELLEEATKQGFGWYACGQKPLELKTSLEVNNYTFYEDKTITHNTSDTCISYKEYKAMSGFTKADLKPCMVVEIERENKTILSMICTNSKDELCVSGESFWCPLYEFGDDMIYSKNIIKKVYGFCSSNRNAWAVSKNDRKLLWERKEEPQTEEMTLAEVCKALGKNIKIVKE